MTDKKESQKPFFFFLMMMPIALLLFFAKDSASFVRKGLALCAQTVIPALFPHLVLSDLLTNYFPSDIHTRKGGLLSSLCRRLRLPHGAPLLFLVGGLSGFPIGARLTCDLYRDGGMSEEAAKDLAAFTNNTGPSFVIAAVGACLFSSLTFGWLFFISEILAAIVCLIIGAPFRPHIKENTFTTVKKENRGFVPAVRRAAETCLFICGFILFFSIVSGFVLLWLPPFSALGIVSFVEVSNACRTAAELKTIMPHASLGFAAFSIGFGGLSAALQSALCMHEGALSFRGYIPRKILQGTLTVLFFFLLTRGGQLW